MSYPITQDYIKHGNSRSGKRIQQIKFIVSHDTGNPGSTAYGNRHYFDRQQPSASAQTFIDDKYILEIIPLYEKAWHVQYQKPKDNELFGADANDASVGVELCYGGKINFQEAYKRYVWYHAYLCKTFNLHPKKHIIDHKTLDPERKTDPHNALNQYGITWDKFINDVLKIWNGEAEDEMLAKKFEPKEQKDLTPGQLNCLKRLASIGVVAADYKPSEIDLVNFSMMDALARKLGAYNK